MKNLRELRKTIKVEREFVGLKPYSHNIISCVLRQISTEFGYATANKAIKDFDLESLGWKPEKEGEV